MTGRTIPRATYRLQLHAGFTFDDAAELAPYLRDLGVSHVYTSPQLQAVEGSTHGYDVVDHSRVSDDLGGEPARQRYLAALKAADLAQVVDVVPNHMAIGTSRNRWWWSLLREGPDSPAAAAFDIDWDPPDATRKATVLLPVLADHYGRILEAGGMRLEAVHPEPGQDTEIVVRYGESSFPLRVGSLADATGTDDWASAIEQVNGSVDLLDAVLDAQHYRLAYWRTGGYELDYRRFFDVTNLAGIRVEDPAVFQLTHELLGSWVAAGCVNGIRVDHPDGLADPAGYLARLRTLAPDAWIVVEKILESGEGLPPWPVDGTTGYDALAMIGGLIIDTDGVLALEALAAELTGEETDVGRGAIEAKQQVLGDLLPTELRRLVSLLRDVCERHRRYRDYARHELDEVLVAVLVHFGVYRTYVTEDGGRSDQDLAVIDAAVEQAARDDPDLDPDLLLFVGSLLRADAGFANEAETELRMRFQQLTGPTMAKAVEDTLLYRHLAVLAANEVGADPSAPATSVASFHRASSRRNEDWPATMLALTTHDTKRSEDVRARLSLLSEIPEEWTTTVRHWLALNQGHHTGFGPDPLTEYLIYQTLVGAHPLPVDRGCTYLVKAMREAKRVTSWLAPNAEAEEAATQFLTAILADDRFIESLDAFVEPLIGPGRTNSLALKLVQLTSPGVPDLYQGSELWDLSLVDPDNRRPVDFVLRSRSLAALRDSATDLSSLDCDQIGVTKLLVVQRCLALRAELTGAYRPGASYEPLWARGTLADHVVAFVRGGQAITVVPRLVMGLTDGWSDTSIELPPGTWRNALHPSPGRPQPELSGQVELDRLFESVPVALLARSGPDDG